MKKNLANIITLSRIFFVFIVVVLLFFKECDKKSFGQVGDLDRKNEGCGSVRDTLWQDKSADKG